MFSQQNKNTSKHTTPERKPRGGSRKNTSNYNDVVMVQGGGDGTYQSQFRAELMTISFHFGPVFPRHMGFMVGSKGSSLKEIMSHSGAKITTMPPDKMHSYPWFLVQGYYPQVQETVGRLNELRAIADKRIPYTHGQRHKQNFQPPQQNFQPPQQNFQPAQQVEDVTHDRSQSPTYRPQTPTYSPQSPSYDPSFSSTGGMDASFDVDPGVGMSAENYSATTPPPCHEEALAPAAPKKKIVRKKRVNDNK